MRAMMFFEHKREMGGTFFIAGKILRLLSSAWPEIL